MAREYDQFREYLVDHGLESVCELKPIINGQEIMKGLGARNGPWMSKATTMVVEYQLLHPESGKEAALEEIGRRRAELGL